MASLAVHGVLLFVLYLAYGALQEDLIIRSLGLISPTLLLHLSTTFTLLVTFLLVIINSRLSPTSESQSPLSLGRSLVALPEGTTIAHICVVGSLGWVASMCQWQVLCYLTFTTTSLTQTLSTIPFLVTPLVTSYFSNKGSKKLELVKGAATLALLGGFILYLAGSGGGDDKPGVLDDDETFARAAVGSLWLLGYLCSNQLYLYCLGETFGPKSSPSPLLSPSLSHFSAANNAPLLLLHFQLPAIVLSTLSLTFVAHLSTSDLAPLLPLVYPFVGLFALSTLGSLATLYTVTSFGVEVVALLQGARLVLGTALNTLIFGGPLAGASPAELLGAGLMGSGAWLGVQSGVRRRAGVEGGYSGLGQDEEETLSEDGSLLMTEPGNRRAREREESVSTVNSSRRGSGGSEEALLPAYTLLWSKQEEAEAREWESLMATARGWLVRWILPAAVPVALFSLLALLPSSYLSTSPSAASSSSIAEVDLVFSSHSNTSSSNPSSSSQLSTSPVHLEGGIWDAEAYASLSPDCRNTLLNAHHPARRWNGTRKTALASHPRSGNTLTRELVERATGLQTSTVYCDKALHATFLGECDHSAHFLVKTHFPTHTYDATNHPSYVADLHFDQAIHLVRNPLDAIYSDYQLAHAPRLPDGSLDHSARIDVGKLGGNALQRVNVLARAEIYRAHYEYWSSAEIPVLKVRYEDLMSSRLSSTLAILSFLLPPAELPSLSALACELETDESLEAYKSQKPKPFVSWHDWDPSLRREVVEINRRSFCREGYGALAAEVLGEEGKAELDGICG
ncbi:hypothetical protein BCR35DRAFT_303502 [Leucosporidium creatinivorum]|uniref:Sulfotransferase domain-containing protein n=1 Tax=Leucosporidium creatinivorum TaxID=106004 RepID=A0A1Y2FG36_9BASI|nr:hypothetical protein BCR35DRAFT_303502 [Leucosporidium creatinivorum]